MNAKEVDFCKFLTGHDDETIIELYTKWERNRDKQSGQFEQQVIPKIAEDFTLSELGLFREWFFCIKDIHPKYFKKIDYDLVKKVFKLSHKPIPKEVSNFSE